MFKSIKFNLLLIFILIFVLSKSASSLINYHKFSIKCFNEEDYQNYILDIAKVSKRDFKINLNKYNKKENRYFKLRYMKNFFLNKKNDLIIDYTHFDKENIIVIKIINPDIDTLGIGNLIITNKNVEKISLYFYPHNFFSIVNNIERIMSFKNRENNKIIFLSSVIQNKKILSMNIFYKKYNINKILNEIVRLTQYNSLYIETKKNNYILNDEKEGILLEAETKNNIINYKILKTFTNNNLGKELYELNYYLNKYNILRHNCLLK